MSMISFLSGKRNARPEPVSEPKAVESVNEEPVELSDSGEYSQSLMWSDYDFPDEPHAADFDDPDDFEKSFTAWRTQLSARQERARQDLGVVHEDLAMWHRARAKRELIEWIVKGREVAVVGALLARGHSVRSIENLTMIDKSRVSRLSKQIAGREVGTEDSLSLDRFSYMTVGSHPKMPESNHVAHALLVGERDELLASHRHLVDEVYGDRVAYDSRDYELDGFGGTSFTTSVSERDRLVHGPKSNEHRVRIMSPRLDPVESLGSIQNVVEYAKTRFDDTIKSLRVYTYFPDDDVVRARMEAMSRYYLVVNAEVVRLANQYHSLTIQYKMMSPDMDNLDWVNNPYNFATDNSFFLAMSELREQLDAAYAVWTYMNDAFDHFYQDGEDDGSKPSIGTPVSTSRLSNMVLAGVDRHEVISATSKTYDNAIRHVFSLMLPDGGVRQDLPLIAVGTSSISLDDDFDE